MIADMVLAPAGAWLLHQDAREQNDLLVWCVTGNPSDYPDRFVARPTSVRRFKALHVVLLADTLEALRKQLPAGLTRIGRRPADDPVIIEVWL